MMCHFRLYTSAVSEASVSAEEGNRKQQAESEGNDVTEARYDATPIQMTYLHTETDDIVV
jgi:hypothetical protein